MFLSLQLSVHLLISIFSFNHHRFTRTITTWSSWLLSKKITYRFFFPSCSNLILLLQYSFCVFDVFYWHLSLSSLLSPSMSSLFSHSHAILDTTISQNTTDTWLCVTDFIKILGGCNEVIISQCTTENNLYCMIETHILKHQSLPWDFPLLYSNLSVKGFI